MAEQHQQIQQQHHQQGQHITAQILNVQGGVATLEDSTPIQIMMPTGVVNVMEEQQQVPQHVQEMQEVVPEAVGGTQGPLEDPKLANKKELSKQWKSLCKRAKQWCSMHDDSVPNFVMMYLDENRLVWEGPDHMESFISDEGVISAFLRTAALSESLIGMEKRGADDVQETAQRPAKKQKKSAETATTSKKGMTDDEVIASILEKPEAESQDSTQDIGAGGDDNDSSGGGGQAAEGDQPSQSTSEGPSQGGEGDVLSQVIESVIKEWAPGQGPPPRTSPGEEEGDGSVERRTLNIKGETISVVVHRKPNNETFLEVAPKVPQARKILINLKKLETEPEANVGSSHRGDNFQSLQMDDYRDPSKPEEDGVPSDDMNATAAANIQPANELIRNYIAGKDAVSTDDIRRSDAAVDEIGIGDDLNNPDNTLDGRKLGKKLTPAKAQFLKGDHCYYLFEPRKDYRETRRAYAASVRHIEATCERCGLVVRKRYMSEHLKLVHGTEDPWECKVCHEKFRYKNTRDVHENKHSDDPRPFKCSKCPKSYPCLKYLTLHEKAKHRGHDSAWFEHPEKTALCYLCAKMFTPWGLRCHLKKTHPGGVTEKATKPRMKTVYSKQKKPKQRPKKPGFWFQCPFCDSLFRTQHSLAKHIRVSHKGQNENLAYGIEKRFISNRKTVGYKWGFGLRRSCNVCHKSVSRLDFRHHLLLHRGVEPHHCSVCDAAFRYAGSLRLHMMLHFRGKSRIKRAASKQRCKQIAVNLPYKCKICQQTFPNRKYFWRHQKSHGILIEAKWTPKASLITSSYWKCTGKKGRKGESVEKSAVKTREVLASLPVGHVTHGARMYIETAPERKVGKKKSSSAFRKPVVPFTRGPKLRHEESVSLEDTHVFIERASRDSPSTNDDEIDRSVEGLQLAEGFDLSSVSILEIDPVIKW